MRKGARTVRISRYGGVEVIEVVSVPKPTAEPGEIVVQVIAAGINHIEAYIRDGRFRDEIDATFPHGQGSDFAGIVVERGHGVTTIAKHADVIGHAVLAAQADYVVVPVDAVIPKPANLEWEVAGGLYLASVTADEILRTVNVGAGDTVVVNAAAGGVGSLETQLARIRGAKVVGTCSARNFDYLRSVGVKPVLYGEGIVDRMREAAPQGVTAYIDNFGGDALALAAELGVAASRVATSDHRKAVELRAITATGDYGMRAVEQVAKLLSDKQLSILISGFYPFDQVREAYDDLDKRHSRGKVVLGMEPVNYPFQAVKATGQKQRDFQEQRA